MVKAPITEHQQPFLGEGTRGSAFLSAERKASPFEKSRAGKSALQISVCRLGKAQLIVSVSLFW
jgi:hypothetical protein